MTAITWLWGCLLVCLQMSVTRPQSSYTKENYPNPQTNHTKCGRTKSSYVCDPHNFIFPTVKAIDAAIKDLQDLKGCPCEACGDGKYASHYLTVAVAIVPSIKGNFLETDDVKEATLQFARHLRRESWAFRGEECENDVVIVLNWLSKEVYISLGREARNQFSTACIENLLRQLDDLQGGYGEAIEVLLTKIRKALEHHDMCGVELDVGQMFWISVGLLAIAGLMAFVSSGYGAYLFIRYDLRRNRVHPDTPSTRTSNSTQSGSHSSRPATSPSRPPTSPSVKTSPSRPPTSPSEKTSPSRPWTSPSRPVTSPITFSRPATTPSESTTKSMASPTKSMKSPTKRVSMSSSPRSPRRSTVDMSLHGNSTAASPLSATDEMEVRSGEWCM